MDAVLNNNLHKFNIRLKQQLVILLPMLLKNAALPIFCYMIYGKLNFGYLIVGLIFFFIDILPTIILHIQYLYKNNGQVVTINSVYKTIKFKERNASVKEYKFGDILSLEYYCCYIKGTGWHSFGQYRFYKIVFSDSYQMFITCLMINDIEHVLPYLLDIEPQKHLRILPLIKAI